MSEKLTIYRLKDGKNDYVRTGSDEMIIGHFALVFGYEYNGMFNIPRLCICYLSKGGRVYRVEKKTILDWYEKIMETEIDADNEEEVRNLAEDRCVHNTVRHDTIRSDPKDDTNRKFPFFGDDVYNLGESYKELVDTLTEYAKEHPEEIESAVQGIRKYHPELFDNKGKDKWAEEHKQDVENNYAKIKQWEKIKNEDLDNLRVRDYIFGSKKENIEVGGQHYQTAIQPWDYIHANHLDFDSGNIVKYASRHKKKGGAEDVKKIISYAKHTLKTQYNEEV